MNTTSLNAPASGLLTPHLEAIRSAVSVLVARFQHDRPVQLFILLLILGNFFWFGLFAIHALPGLDLIPKYLLLDQDQSVPEFFNYAQTLLCVALLLALAGKTRELVYAAWGAVFAFVAMDDAFSVHESGARLIQRWVELPALPGLRPQETGEMLVWSMVAVPLLVLLIVGFRRSSREAGWFGAVFVLLFAALVFFGVALDMLHTLVLSIFGVERMVAFAEDGGEMLTLGITCATALLLYRSYFPPLGRAGTPVVGSNGWAGGGTRA
jgi:hypothetical protein